MSGIEKFIKVKTHFVHKHRIFVICIIVIVETSIFLDYGNLKII